MEKKTWIALMGLGYFSSTILSVVQPERARLQYGLSPGQHILKVTTIAGTCDRLLLSVRQPE
jgi:hypothetical protein